MDNVINGTLKLNEERQYGLGAEVLRFWLASLDVPSPTSHALLFAEDLLSIQFLDKTLRERN